MEKYLVSNAPYLRRADYGHSTRNIMRDLMISLVPVILFSIYKNVILVAIKNPPGVTFIEIIYPLITLIVSPIWSLALEILCLYIMKRKEIKSFSDLKEEAINGFGMIPGLLIVLISPVYVKMWVLLVSIAVGEIVGKMLFGGFGQNIFNPALVGRAFMAFAFSYNNVSLITVSAFDNYSMNSFFNAYEAYNASIDAVASATPLSNFQSLNELSKNTVLAGYTLLDYFIGTIPGALGETSALACIIGYVYLVVRRIIDWKVPVIYVLVVFLITLIQSFFNGQGFYYPIFQILSGGLMFGAVFMATEPVTSPKTNLGRIMNAMMLGVLTCLFRLIGSLPEGVATAIVTMNIFGLVINKYCIHMRVDGKVDKNEVPGLIVFIVIFVGLFIYDVIAVL